jgi:hypothetical protein
MIIMMVMLMLMIMMMLIMLGCGSIESMNRFGMDLVGEGRGSDSECLAGFECFLNIVRALGMGSCISEGSGSPPLLTYSQELNVDGGKRRRLRGSSTMDYKVPGRMFLNGSSEIASMYCKQGKKGINQDAMLVWEVCFVIF